MAGVVEAEQPKGVEPDSTETAVRPKKSLGLVILQNATQ